MNNKIKTLLGITLTLFSLPTLAECKWDTIIDTQKWYKSYQVPEASMIYLTQVVNERYLIFNQYDIVLDVAGAKVNHLRQGQSLMDTTRFIGTTGEKITFTSYTGFPIKKVRYVPIFDMYKDVYKYCSTKYLKDNNILLN